MKVAYNIISLHTILQESFEGENFCEFFAILGLLVKVFSVKFEGVASFGMAICGSFLCEKSYFSPIHGSFLHQKFPAMWESNYDFYWCQSFRLKAVCTSLLA